MGRSLESVCSELRLDRIPSLINSIEAKNKKEWLLKLLTHEVASKDGRRIQ